MSDVHRDNLVAFEVELPTFERLGSNQAGRDQSWKPPAPILDGIGCERCLHSLHYLGRSDRPCLRKALLQQLQPEKVVWMRVGDIDHRQTLAGGKDPIGQFLVLLVAQESIDEQGVLL